MALSQSKRVLLMTIALVLCAGLVVGRLSATLVPTPPPPHDHSPSWLQDQLGLSGQQKQQMDAIWTDAKTQLDKTWDGRHELDRQRDDEIHNLLTAQQQAAFAKIYDDYHARRAELEKQRGVLIKSAEDRSRSLLSDSQKTRWDSLTKEMHERRGPHGPGGPGGPGDRGPGDRGPDDRGPGDHGPGDHGPASTQGWHGMRGMPMEMPPSAAPSNQ